MANSIEAYPIPFLVSDLQKLAVLTGAAESLTATGSTVADAALVASEFTKVSNADATKGVILPADSAGRARTISNISTAILKVYPPTDATINDLAVTVADLLRPGETKTYVFVSATAIHTIGGRPAGVVTEERTFTETSGAGTYTGSVVLPAGATLLDIIVNGVALWDNAGAVTMKVGDTDDDGYYTGINLKATDLLAGESISFSHAGGKAGVYFAGTNTHIAPRYSATARTINGIITTASTGGSAGRTRMTVVYSVNPNAVAATKV